jgi:hypothetical protein
MISQITNIKDLLKGFEEYLKTNGELLKLKSVDKSADIISTVFTAVIVILAGIIFLCVLTVALSFLIGRLTGSLELGFFIMAAFWGIFCAILYWSRAGLLKKPAQDTVVKKLLD